MTSSTSIREYKKHLEKELNSLYNTNESNSIINILLEFVTKYSKVDLILNQETQLIQKQFHFLESAITELKRNKPIQYIIGSTQFYGLEFIVNPSVLIPRPETEELVQWIINDTKNLKNINILDVGTGSGCIAISLANELSDANIYAIDVSIEAIETAKENAEKNDVKIEFIVIDLFSNEMNNIINNKQIIVSNPPYIPYSFMSKTNLNVLNFEPHNALFVNDNEPLLFYKRVLNLVKETNNKSECIIYFEIFEDLKDQLEKLCQDYNIKEVTFKKDINEKYRMLKCVF